MTESILKCDRPDLLFGLLSRQVGVSAPLSGSPKGCDLVLALHIGIFICAHAPSGSISLVLVENILSLTCVWLFSSPFSLPAFFRTAV
jgi:hypothetical protein